VVIDPYFRKALELDEKYLNFIRIRVCECDFCVERLKFIKEKHKTSFDLERYERHISMYQKYDLSEDMYEYRVFEPPILLDSRWPGIVRV
jgi:hypothetical protein